MSQVAIGIKMRGSLLAANIMSLICALHSAQADPLPSQDSLYQEAHRMIERCLEYAADNKLSPLSVAVVDESGTPIEFKRQNGAPALTADAALLKARTAVRAHLATSALVTQSAAERDLLLLLQLTELPGGIPINRNGAFVGAVGVSGEAPEKDAACAQHAVEGGGADVKQQAESKRR
jgi:glc operon protein GlcG